MSYKLTNYERETIVNFNDDEDIANVYTCNRALIRKLDTYCKKRPDLYKLVEKDDTSKTFEFPKRYISIRLPKVLSEKEKTRLSKSGFGRKSQVSNTV